MMGPSLAHVGSSQFLKRPVMPKYSEDHTRLRKNNTRVFALKPPKQPVPPETEETEVGTSEEKKKETKEVEEEKVIKVEKKGFLGQIQNFFAWIGAWPSVPSKVLILNPSFFSHAKFFYSYPASRKYLSLGFCFDVKTGKNHEMT